MPTTHNIPARTERRCEPCEFLKRINMICSRLDGIKCDYVCKHLEAYDDRPVSSDPTVAAKVMAMRMRMIQKRGRDIGRNDIQPEWCPLRRESAEAQAR